MSTSCQHPRVSTLQKPLPAPRRWRGTSLLGACVLLAASGLVGCKEPPTESTSFAGGVIVSGVVRNPAGAPVAGVSLQTEHRRRGCDSTCTERYQSFSTNERGEFKQTAFFYLGQTETSVLSLLVTPPAGTRLRPEAVPFDARLENLPHDSVHLVVVLNPE